MPYQRYSRQTMLSDIGIEGQARLAQARVLIVGAGGLGSPVAMYLAGAGIGTIGLVDADTVSETNLQRQILYEQSQIGQPKTDMASLRLSALNPGCTIYTYNCRLDADNAMRIIAQYDVVIDCTDNFQTRFVIDDACSALNKTWIHGAIGRFEGRVAVFTPDCRVRYADLMPDRDSLCNMPPKTEGVIGPVPGVIGAIQACEAIKHIVGIADTLAGQLFTINLLTMTTNTIEL